MKPQTNLLAINALVLGLDDKVLNTRNMHACGLNLLRYFGVFEGANNLLQLGGVDAETWGCGPDGGALRIEDGSLINGTSTKKARGQSALRSLRLWMLSKPEDEREDDHTWNRRMLNKNIVSGISEIAMDATQKEFEEPYLART
jgi:hypothetical protein